MPGSSDVGPEASWENLLAKDGGEVWELRSFFTSFLRGKFLLSYGNAVM